MLPLCAAPLHRSLLLTDAYSYVILCTLRVRACLHASAAHNHSASAHDLAEYHVENP